MGVSSQAFGFCPVILLSNRTHNSGQTMKSIKKAAFLLVGLVFSMPLYGQDRGEALFNQTCVACHTIGKGRLVGPDLANVHSRREEAWIIRFVQSSQGLIRDQDPDAVALFEEYNRIVMPDHALSADDVRAILGYIARKSPSGAAPAAAAEAPSEAAPAPAEAVALGQALFVGQQRFVNGGPACNACHTANNEAVLTGGALAKDLTTAYSRLTGPGIRAMVASPPFPPMRVAFEGRPVTDEEIDALVAFLQATDAAQLAEAAHPARTTLVTGGLLGFVLLLGFFTLLGLRRTKRSVNQRIYDRQLKSA